MPSGCYVNERVPVVGRDVGVKVAAREEDAAAGLDVADLAAPGQRADGGFAHLEDASNVRDCQEIQVISHMPILFLTPLGARPRMPRRYQPRMTVPIGGVRP